MVCSATLRGTVYYPKLFCLVYNADDRQHTAADNRYRAMWLCASVLDELVDEATQSVVRCKHQV